jgi:cytochrome c peroxidase
MPAPTFPIDLAELNFRVLTCELQSTNARLEPFMRKPVLNALVVAAFATVPLAAAAAETPTLAEMKALYVRPETIPFPEDNAFTPEKATLGQMLFFDPRLSGANYISCATCHNPSFAWGDGLPRGIGHGMTVLGRRTPTVLNLAWTELLMWDGRKASLEEQALGPMEAKVEMNQDLDELPQKLSAIEGYRRQFEAIFPEDGITLDTIAKAIATYERTIVSGEAPFDRWIEGDEDAISESAKRGFVTFNTKGNCAACHAGWNFSDGGFYDIGLPDEDVGRFAILDLPSMQHAFKTPTLREVELRGPYMHDGSVATLEAVIEHYDNGFVERPSLSGEMRKLDLTREEKADLVAFLSTLTGENPPVNVPLLYVGPQTAQR